MNKNLLSKILALGIVVLFIGVGVYPAFGVEIKSTIDDKKYEDDCGCQEVSNQHLVRFERISSRLEILLNRLEVYTKIIPILSKNNPVVIEKYEDLSIEIKKLKEANEELKTINPSGENDIICNFLLLISFPFFALFSFIITIAESFPEGSFFYNFFISIAYSFIPIIERLGYLLNKYECLIPP